MNQIIQLASEVTVNFTTKIKTYKLTVVSTTPSDNSVDGENNSRSKH